MSELLNLFPCVKMGTVYVFLAGMLCGLLLLLLLMLAGGLLCLIFRSSRKVPGVALNAPHGTLFISARAIADLIGSLRGAFPDLEIARVVLVREKKDFVLRVKVCYAAGGPSMLALASEFQQQALGLLKNSFGIENIARIDLTVPRGKN